MPQPNPNPHPTSWRYFCSAVYFLAFAFTVVSVYLVYLVIREKASAVIILGLRKFSPPSGPQSLSWVCATAIACAWATGFSLH